LIFLFFAILQGFLEGVLDFFGFLIFFAMVIIELLLIACKCLGVNGFGSL
jgi:hypothetical protein